MEIKILCPCGAKYQFPVEPVNGMLPRPVACPVCGADNTALGNAAIQQQSPTPPSNPSPTAAGLRIKATEPTDPALPPIHTAPPIASSYPPAYRPGAHAPSSATGNKIKAFAKTTVSIVLVLVGIWVIYSKWSQRAGKFSDLISAVSGVGDDEGRWTLPMDDAGALLVKHNNHTEVANALSAAHLKLNNQQLQTISTTNLFDEDAEYFVNEPHNGAVYISGSWDWSEPGGEKEASDIAGEISKALNTHVVMALMGDDGEAGVYAVFENGERKFRLKRWYQITRLTADGIKEFVERDGEAWAAQHGYVPDPDKILTGDTDRMAFEDANELTLKLGIDISDVEYEEGVSSLVLKPAAAATGKASKKKSR